MVGKCEDVDPAARRWRRLACRYASVQELVVLVDRIELVCARAGKVNPRDAIAPFAGPAMMTRSRAHGVPFASSTKISFNARV